MSEILNTLMQDARVWQGQHHTRTGRPTEPTGYQVLDNQLGGVGWPRGALSECLLDEPGIGELHLLLPLMQRLSQAGKTVFWLNPPHTPYAPALARRRGQSGSGHTDQHRRRWRLPVDTGKLPAFTRSPAW